MNPILRLIRDRVGAFWSSVIAFFAALGVTVPDLSGVIEQAQTYISPDGSDLFTSAAIAIITYLGLKKSPEVETAKEPDLSPVQAPEVVQAQSWVFGTRSKERLKQAHRDLQRVHVRGLQLSPLDFSIIETNRTPERQAELKAEGKSMTLDSRHVETPAMAVDHVPIVDGKACWDWWAFEKTTDALKQAAEELGIDCDFGIDWKSFPDGAHVELNRNVYPKIDVELA